MIRLCFVSLLGAVALSGCEALPLGGQAQADAQTRVACQQQAEEVYDQQNRGEIYSPQSPVNTPYSANYVPDSSDRGLSDLFVHERLVNDCVRNTGTGTDRSVPESTPTPPGPTPPGPTPPGPPPLRH
jgi:hypothetical protein